MRLTVTLDDAQLAQAIELTGIRDTSALLGEALRALIQREAAWKLALLGGSVPNATRVPRRQPKTRP